MAYKGSVPWNKGITGEQSHMYGLIQSAATRRKKSEALTGRVFSNDSRRKMRENHADVSGVNNPRYGKPLSEEVKRRIRDAVAGKKHRMYGKKHTEQTKQRMRLASLAIYQKNGGVISRIGRNEQALLDKQEKLDGVVILRQYPISELGYVVDGYCVNTNTVYEVYEATHLRARARKRDVLRQQRIEVALGCKFVIIHDR